MDIRTDGQMVNRVRPWLFTTNFYHLAVIPFPTSEISTLTMQNAFLGGAFYFVFVYMCLFVFVFQARVALAVLELALEQAGLELKDLSAHLLPPVMGLKASSSTSLYKIRPH